MNKGKILLFTTDFPPAQGGGIGTHAHFMVDSLRELGWEFSVLSEYYIPCSTEEIREYSNRNGYTINQLPSSPTAMSLLKKIFFCWKVALKYKPDLIIGTGRHTTWFAALISFLTRRPLVTIGHGTEFTQITSKNDIRNNRLAYNRSTLLIAISHHTEKIIHKVGLNPKKIEVIHNAANETIFKKIDENTVQDFINSKGLQNKKIILTSGALTTRKGQKVVIESLPRVLENHPNLVYVAVGLPNKKEEFIELAQKLNIEENVLFPGIVEIKDLVLWLNACEFFIMTSVNDDGDYEGFGIAVIEAALCGKTSIVSDNGGLPEAVEHGFTGIVVQEKNILETSNAINSLLNNPERLAKLSKNAWDRAFTRYTYQNKADEYNKVLSDII